MTAGGQLAAALARNSTLSAQARLCGHSKAPCAKDSAEAGGLTLGWALQGLGDLHVVHDVGLDAVAPSLNLQPHTAPYKPAPGATTSCRRQSRDCVHATYPSLQLGHLVAVERVACIGFTDVDRHGCLSCLLCRCCILSGFAGVWHKLSQGPLSLS